MRCTAKTPSGSAPSFADRKAKIGAGLTLYRSYAILGAGRRHTGTSMEDSSILDKVLSSKQVADIANFHPSETLTLLLKELTPKEEETLERRFGLRDQPKETLEEIGKRYAVTRERVRQIEEMAIKKIKVAKRFHDVMRGPDELIRELLEQHGGAMTEDALIRELFRDVAMHESDRRALLFMLNELFLDRYDRIAKTAKIRAGWKLKGVSLSVLDEMLENIVATIHELGEASSFEAIYTSAKQKPYFLSRPDRLSEEMMQSYLELSMKIGKNPFQEYGLGAWGTIVPKRMNDKIYLILKKHGKPLHFTDITKNINETGFDRRTAYPPTVHNELILNKQYVLVGRGVYALKEWGYKPGVVADVIKETLDNAGQPLTRDEIVKRVLEQRMVKKNTVHLALADKKRFERLQDGTYRKLTDPVSAAKNLPESQT